VLGLLHVILGLDKATLALGDELKSTLVGCWGEVELQNTSAEVGRKLQEWEGCARLDDNGLQAVVKHIRTDKLKLLRSDKLDDLTEAAFLGQDLRIVRHSLYSTNQI
jgi:hypothetical protein